MFRRLCNAAPLPPPGHRPFSAAENATIKELATAHARLLSEGMRLDVRSEAGALACSAFLTRLEDAAELLYVKAAPRNYRAEFSVNYRALFPDNSRHYRVDVLEVSVEQHAAIWVNGDKFELSPEAIVHAEELQYALAHLGAVLQPWVQAQIAEHRPSRNTLCAALVTLDCAWANFEHKYISNLIRIEDQARNLIVQAVEAERRLRAVESTPDSAEYREAQRSLVACVAHMNSVANSRRKGRDDLGEDILDSAAAVLLKCGKSEAAEEAMRSPAARSAAKVLAADVVGAWDAMRGYLQEVSKCLERVDPHLCNNVGLVARLVDWEESWEVGAKYVRQTVVLDAVCSLVSEIRAAGVSSPKLIEMCTDCDVELFFVLPRIIILCFMADPTEQRAGLLRTLLPNHFQVEGHDDAVGADAEVRTLSDLFQQTVQVLENTLPEATTKSGARMAAWEALVKRAVRGAPDASCGAAMEAVETLMRQLEGLSLELQRHCPEDWNQCSAVFVQCLNGASKRPKVVHFQV